MEKRISKEELKSIQKELNNDEMTVDSQNNKKDKPSNEKSKHSVLVYTIALFSVVIILIGISYFLQQKSNEQTISNLTQSHAEFSNQVMANIAELQDENVQYVEEINELNRQIEELEESLSTVTSERDSLEADKDMLLAESEQDKNKLAAVNALFQLQIDILDENIEAATETAKKIETNKVCLNEEQLKLYEALLKEINN